MKKDGGNKAIRTKLGRLLTLTFIAVFACSIVSLFQIVTTSAPDFSVFYRSAANLVQGMNLYRDKTLFTGLGYPPVTLLPFLSLTLLPYQVAQGIGVFGSFFVFIGSLAISLKLVDELKRTTFMAAFILAFLSFPARFTLGMGQVNFYALALLLSSVYFIKSHQKISALALIGALVVKPHLVILLPFFLVAGKWKLALGSLAGYILLTVVAGVLFGWFQLVTYLTSMLPPLLAFQGREIYYNQGLSGFFSRIVFPASAQELTYVASFVIYFLSLIVSYRQKLDLAKSLVIILPTFLLIEPLSWQHHYVFLIPVFIYLTKNYWRKWWKLGILVISYLLISWNIRSPAIWKGEPLGGLVLSHVFLGTVLLYILSLLSTA